MLIIAGIIMVFASVIGGFLMEKGQLLVLFQPAELLIIGGASCGSILIANPPHLVKKILKGILRAFGKPKYSEDRYRGLLKTLYDLLTKARKDGTLAIEADVEKPETSPILSPNLALMADHHALTFLCDSMRMSITGFDTFELDQLLDLDIEVHHREASQPVTALTTVADAMPGLGIVAAVLGVVITMGAIGGPPEEVGHKVAAALVGTFLGVLLCYGLVGPLAQNMAKAAEDDAAQLQVIRTVIISYLKGSAPIMAVEVGRRAIPDHVRPSFKAVADACRAGGAAAAARPAPEPVAAA